MSGIRFGNLTVAQFADAVGAEFTEAEIAILESHRTDVAEFTDADKFHIFDSPAISIHLGPEVDLGLFVACNKRKTFNRPVSFYLSTHTTNPDKEPTR